MLSTILQIVVVFGAIAMGARYGGIGLGIWGGIGLFLLVFVFGLRPTSAPVDVLLIMIAVATFRDGRGGRGGLHGPHSRKDHPRQSEPNRAGRTFRHLVLRFPCGHSQHCPVSDASDL